uniref:Ring finger protein 135 n=1 Tax=Molossus molossus TaxID=27622 RepID=A0A7J8D182_MOLMO|nr:ring finger protein 135 [Molossus molossus]
MAFVPLTQSLATTDLFTVSLVLPFLECHIVGIIQYLAFSDWHLSQSKIKVTAPKGIPEVGHELAELVDQLVDIVRSLQNQRHLPESGPENKLNTLGMAFSGGVDHSSAAPQLGTPSMPEEKVRDILHNLEDIRGKLQDRFAGKEPLEEQRQVKLPKGLSSSSGPLTDQDHLASRFAQRAISPTFDLKSLSCSLELSEDCRMVTVSHIPQLYPWNPDRFTTCQRQSLAAASGRSSCPTLVPSFPSNVL